MIERCEGQNSPFRKGGRGINVLRNNLSLQLLCLHRIALYLTAYLLAVLVLHSIPDIGPE